MDFPATVPILPVISSWSPYAIGSSVRSIASGVPSSGAWPTANQARYVPFVLPANYLVRALWWCNGTVTVSGNVDCGIYTASGALLTSTGSTAQAGLGAAQSVTLGTPVLLTAGNYNMALALSSATGEIFRNTGLSITRMSGVTMMTSAFPLPAAFVPEAATAGYVPLFGIASRTVI